MKLNDEILKIHEQKYPWSCVPSAVEMVLKLHGIIEPNDFYLQKRFSEESIGGGHIVDFFNQDNKIIKFYQKVYDDIDEYFKVIKEELLTNHKYVIIPLPTDNGNYHAYVVYDYSEKEGFKIFSRDYNNNEIINENNMEERFRNNYNRMKMIDKEKRYGVDILVYTMNVRVNYYTEPLCIKSQGNNGKHFEKTFDSLEKAKAAPLPAGYVFAVTFVENGCYTYSIKYGWEFMPG